MPNRIIKESARTSESLDRLSADAERMFWRLVTVADDFGRFEADPRILLASCFPLKIGTIKLRDIEKWTAELIEVNAIRLYEAGGKRYGVFVSWDDHQTKRAQYSKFPAPPADMEAVRESALPGEVDIEDALVEHLSGQSHFLGQTIIEVNRQVRAEESYIDIIVKTQGGNFLFELKRNRLSNKAILQLERYLNLIPGRGILIGNGLSSNFDLERCKAKQIAVVVYDNTFKMTVIYDAGTVNHNALPDFNMTSRDITGNNAGNNAGSNVTSREDLIRESRIENRESRIENTRSAPHGASRANIFFTHKKKKLAGETLLQFEQFWEAFGYKEGKAEAGDSWLSILWPSDPSEHQALLQRILSAAKQEFLRRGELLQNGRTPKMAQGWLTSRRWEDSHLSVEPRAGPQRFACALCKDADKKHWHWKSFEEEDLNQHFIQTLGEEAGKARFAEIMAWRKTLERAPGGKVT